MAGVFFGALPLWVKNYHSEEWPLLLAWFLLMMMLGIPLSGLGGRARAAWRRRVIGRLSGKMAQSLGGTVRIRPEKTSISWVGEHQGKSAALLWNVEVSSTQVSLRVPGGSPGTLRILPTWTRGGRLMGGRTTPLGHEEFDRLFIAGSEPKSLVYDLFSGNHRDRVVGWIFALPGRYSCRVILTLSDLRIWIPRMVRRRESLMRMLRAADVIVEAILETARTAGYAVVTVGAGTSARCPICMSSLEEEAVLCNQCRTPHHEGCWQYTGECAIFGCGGRRWIRSA